MSKTVLKTFRLPVGIAQEIENGAKEYSLSQTQYVVQVFTENKFLRLKKSFEDSIKGMEHDEHYKREQHDLAESNFL